MGRKRVAVNKQNENDRLWEDDHGLLDEEQITKCARADTAEPFHSPIPTQIISNGEYMPAPQSKNQKRVETRIQEIADSASKRLGVSRRVFLASTGGMAAAFMTMNEIFGRIFNINPIELFEPLANAQTSVPQNIFVFDDQLHFVRGSATGLLDLRALAQGPSSDPQFKTNPYNPEGKLDERGNPWTVWNPALVDQAVDAGYAHFLPFIKDVYLDSQVTVGLLSNVTASVMAAGGEHVAPRNVEEARPAEILTAAQTAAARNFINDISGSTRMLCHGLLYVGKGNLAYIQEQTDQNQPDSWKRYNISNAAKIDNDPTSLMRQWRHDDEEVAYPTFELIEQNYQKLKAQKPGYKNICVHIRTGTWASGPATWAPWGHAEGGNGLAQPKFHHISLLHPTKLFPL